MASINIVTVTAYTAVRAATRLRSTCTPSSSQADFLTMSSQTSIVMHSSSILISTSTVSSLTAAPKSSSWTQTTGSAIPQLPSIQTSSSSTLAIVVLGTVLGLCVLACSTVAFVTYQQFRGKCQYCDALRDQVKKMEQGLIASKRLSHERGSVSTMKRSVEPPSCADESEFGTIPIARDDDHQVALTEHPRESSKEDARKQALARLEGEHQYPWPAGPAYYGEDTDCGASNETTNLRELVQGKAGHVSKSTKPGSACTARSAGHPVPVNPAVAATIERTLPQEPSTNQGYFMERFDTDALADEYRRLCYCAGREDYPYTDEARRTAASLADIIRSKRRTGGYGGMGPPSPPPVFADVDLEKVQKAKKAWVWRPS